MSRFVIGDYVGSSDQTLGGWNSIVYPVNHIRTGQQAVAKVVRFSAPMGKEAFSRETQLLAKLSGNPHVIPLVNTIVSNRSGVMILPRMKTDLMALLLTQPANRMPEMAAKAFFLEIVKGVMECHAQGIAHLDLKPENIFVSKSSQLYLGDFGSGYDTKNGQMVRGMAGTAMYTAPEILAGYMFDPMLADIWSLGIVCFVMVTGTWPYSAIQATNIQDGDPMFLSTEELMYRMRPYSLSPELQDLLCSMIQAQPSKRASLSEIFEHKWFCTSSPEKSESQVVEQESVTSSNCAEFSHSSSEEVEIIESPTKDKAKLKHFTRTCFKRIVRFLF